MSNPAQPPFIFTGEAPDAPWYVSMPEGGFYLASDEAQKAEALAGQNVEFCVILPGQSVRTLATELPEGLKSKERETAARFAVEAELGQPLGALYSRYIAASPAHVVVMDQAQLDGHLYALRRAGVNSARLFADFQLLPEDHGAVRFIDRVIVPGALGYSAPPELSDIQASQVLTLDQFAAALDTQIATPIWQGALRKTSLFQSMGGASKWAAAAAILLALGYGVFYAAQTRAINLQTENILERSAERYTQLTGDPAPRAPGLALAKTQGEKTAPDGFSPVFAQVLGLIEPLPQTRLESVTWNEGRMQISVDFPNLQSANQFETQARSAGLTMQTQSLRELDGIFRGEILVTGGQP